MSAAREVDVLVLGCGVSGVAAALAAEATGANVLVVEQAQPDSHTPNVRMSGGYLMTLTSADEGRAYLSACAGGLVADEVIQAWAGLAVDIEDYLADLDVRLRPPDDDLRVEYPSLPGAGAVSMARAATTLPAFHGEGETGEVVGGEALYRGLMHRLAASSVEVAWGRRPVSLVIDGPSPDGRVRGVRLSPATGDPLQEVLARKGVVLATGGFGANQDIIRQYLSVPTTYFYGNPGNDGGGLHLAMSAGAELARMNRMAGRAIASFVLPGGGRLSFMLKMHPGGYVICDQDGRRFADEYSQAMLEHAFYFFLQEFDLERGRYSRAPSYWIFDERRRRDSPLTYMDRGACRVGLYDWSPDSQREIDAGWIGVGDTPDEAAVAAGAAKNGDFDETVEAYNAACANGSDPLGRPPSSLVPLDEPPFYCVPLYPGGSHTSGGPLRDARGRVIGVGGEPIPGLFSAGELGQAMGLLYPAHGSSLSEALCSGRIAGRAAAE